MEGPDHEFALEPDELDRMVTAIRETERVLGSGEIRVLDAEQELYEKARRGIHAVSDVAVGDPLTDDDVRVLRPGERDRGLHPRFYDDVVGKVAARDIDSGKGIQWDDLED